MYVVSVGVDVEVMYAGKPFVSTIMLPPLSIIRLELYTNSIDVTTGSSTIVDTSKLIVSPLIT